MRKSELMARLARVEGDPEVYDADGFGVKHVTLRFAPGFADAVRLVSHNKSIPDGCKEVFWERRSGERRKGERRRVDVEGIGAGRRQWLRINRKDGSQDDRDAGRRRLNVDRRKADRRGSHV